MPIHEVRTTGLILELADSPDVTWTIVYYNHPHADLRSPYTDGLTCARVRDGATGLVSDRWAAFELDHTARMVVDPGR